MGKLILLIGLVFLNGVLTSCVAEARSRSEVPIILGESRLFLGAAGGATAESRPSGAGRRDSEHPLDRSEMITKTALALASMKMPDLYGKYLDTRTLEVIDYDAMMSRLKDIQVIYLAEEHTNMAHHRLQADVLKSLSAGNPKTALAMEFLYRSQQVFLDDYSAGKVSDADFDKGVADKFSPGWYPMYSPIIHFARANKLKILGMNVERDIRMKMVTSGWGSLTPEEQKLVAKDIDMSNQAHRALYDKNSAGMKNMMQGPMEERMYKSMCVWDETFGETIANYLKEKNDKNIQVMVILGSGHAAYKFNTPERSYKRFPVPFRTLVPYTLNDNRGKESDFRKLLSENPLIGDFVYFSPVTTR
ncbi:MAG: ChaN family lipoprotein [Planctomycetes bacterium]|nr:ChaN family lipoprotein [Planctomycetota bacterium]